MDALRHRFVRFAAITLLAATPGWSRGEDPRELVSALFEPARVEQVLLSPDGQRVAFVRRETSGVALRVADLELPPPAGSDRRPWVESSEGKTLRLAVGMRVSFVHWVGNDTVVYALAVRTGGRGFGEEVHAFVLSTNTDRKLIESEDVEAAYSPMMTLPLEVTNGQGDTVALPDVPNIPEPRHLRVLALDGTDEPAVIIEAVGSERVPTETYRVGLRTGERKRIATVPGDMRVLYDGHGNARVRETARVWHQPRGPAIRATSSRMPMRVVVDAPAQVADSLLRQYYEYAASGFNRWRRLDGLVLKPALNFSYADEDAFCPASFPLGLDADGTQLYFASDMGRDTVAVYRLDLTRGDCAVVASSGRFDLADRRDAMSDTKLVRDRTGHVQGVVLAGAPASMQWFDAELAEMQRAAEQRFRGRNVRLLDWTDDKTRGLLLVTGPTDPGRFYVMDAGEPPAMTELFRRARNLTAARLALVERIEFATTTGGRGIATITLPKASRVSPPPLVVRLLDVPKPAGSGNGFDVVAQGFAAMGFMVATVEHRGVSGLGRAHREAMAAGPDRLPLEDVQAALRSLEARHAYDHHRVAGVGEGFGGFLALRAAQLFPAQYRCAVCIDGPADPAAWARGLNAERDADSPSAMTLAIAAAERKAFFGPQRAALEQIALLPTLSALTRPVLILRRRDVADVPRSQLLAVQAALRRLDIGAELGETRSTLEQSPSVLMHVTAFLNDRLFSYRVDVGEEKLVK